VEYQTPRPKPQVGDRDAKSVAEWAEAEFLAIGRDLASYRVLDLAVSYAPPTRPRLGMLVCADGTEWDPGSGEGLYRFTGAGTWKYLG
jgi:hypothetical protein